MNEIEPTRSNPAVFPKIRNMEITTTTYQQHFVMSNWKMTLSENSSFQDPDLLFPTPSTNLFRELRESPQSPQERCAMVRITCAQRQEIIFEPKNCTDLDLCLLYILIRIWLGNNNIVKETQIWLGVEDGRDGNLEARSECWGQTWSHEEVA